MSDLNFQSNVILPGIKVAMAAARFEEALEEGMTPRQAFFEGIDTLEQGARRWGNACLECDAIVNWVDRMGPTTWRCPTHGHVTSTRMLISWEPTL